MPRRDHAGSRSTLLLLALLALGAGTTPTIAQERTARIDWPQFRGPNRDGISPETGLLSGWPDKGPRRLWRVPLGRGYSGIVVVGDRLLTMYARDGSEYVAAFDTAAGTERWRYRIDSMYRNGQGHGPRSTPTVVDSRVYALSGGGKLVALDAESGAPIWALDLQQRYGASGPTWGFSTSPLVDGERLLMDIGGEASLVALDRSSGEELWRTGDDKPGYSAPILIDVGDIRQAVFFTGSRVVAVDPASGETFWQQPWRTSYDVNAATPIFIPPDRIFVSSGYGVGSAVLRVVVTDDGVGIETVWRNRELKNQFSSSILHDGYLYGFDNSILECVDAGSGERMWRARGYGHGSLLYADGHLIVLSDRGTLALVQPTPGQHRELARTEVFDGKTWTAPTLANGTLYLRDERELVAVDLTDPADSSRP